MHENTGISIIPPGKNYKSDSDSDAERPSPSSATDADADRTPDCDSEVTAQHLTMLRRSLTMKVPYTGGVHPVKPEDLVVYYDIDGEFKRNARHIDLGNATDEQLVELAAACQKATFGVDQADVLDESYRKAGKMDLTQFSARLDIAADKMLRAEMYKLNVYGLSGLVLQGAQGHPAQRRHARLPRYRLPDRGALTLSHGSSNWIFDSAAQLSPPTSTGPAIAYIAFYNDVTHAVEPVVEGHRVTLTYNLFLVDRPGARPAAAGHRILEGPTQTLEDTLRVLLADRDFLPAGGLLAFGLAHHYPMPDLPRKPRPSPFGPVLRLLKGSDVRIRTAAQRVGLDTHVKVLYDSTRDYDDGWGHDVLTDDVLNMEDFNEKDREITDELERRGVILERGEARVRDLEAMDRENLERGYARGRRYWEENGNPDGAVAVHWVTRITELNRVGSQYIAYGNEPTLGRVYGNAALFVLVPALGNGVRTTA
ncbi:hypothetical protein C8R44DRAFT_872468 [Mycena epipterygia]|nr:hypothetical protein C8R44DRAFT_872468 [Mycena epipterygia]